MPDAGPFACLHTGLYLLLILIATHVSTCLYACQLNFAGKYPTAFHCSFATHAGSQQRFVETILMTVDTHCLYEAATNRPDLWLFYTIHPAIFLAPEDNASTVDTKECLDEMLFS